MNTPNVVVRGLGLLICTAVVTGCATARVQSRTLTPSLTVDSLPPQTGGLVGLRVVDRTSGIVFHVFHDSVSTPLAARTIPTVAAIYQDLARMAGVDAGQVNWFDVAFVQDTLDPRLRASDTSLWAIHVDGSGALSQPGVRHLFYLVPHEQTHAIQRFPRPDLPRWFTEGHAEWQALRSADRFQPAVAEARRTEFATARASVAQPPRLGAWQAIVRIKREAFLRQATPEQRARMERDPAYTPPGPYRFEPGDMESGDVGAGPEIIARYAAAAAVFEDLTRRVGEDAVRNWLRAVWAHETLDPETLIGLAREHTGVDLKAVLR